MIHNYKQLLQENTYTPISFIIIIIFYSKYKKTFDYYFALSGVHVAEGSSLEALGLY